MKSNIWKHPLALTLIGIIASSIVIPLASFWYSTSNELSVKKRELSYEIIDKNLVVCTKLNQIYTMMELYHKELQIVQKNGGDVTQLQQKALDEIRASYLEFNINAWYWNESVRQKARNLGYDEEQRTGLKDDFLKYHDNLAQITQIIDEIWNLTFRDKYSYEDSEKLINSNRHKFTKLLERNNYLIMSIANDLGS